MTVKNIAIGAVLALCMGGSLAAQDRMSDMDCTASWGAFATMMTLPAAGLDIKTDSQGWCLIEDASFDISQFDQIKLRVLRWRATDIARFINGGLPPRAFEIEGEGLGVSMHAGSPVQDYVSALQASASTVGFGVSMRWDGVQNAVHIDSGYIDFSPQNRIEATGLIAGINLSDASTLEASLGTMGLRDLTVKSDVNGWFETYLAQSLGLVLLSDSGEGPEAQVEQIKLHAIEIVNKLPNELVPQASRDALGAFIADMPTPRGRVQMQLSAQPALGMARLAPFAQMSEDPTLDQIIQLGLNNVAVLFTWTPRGGAE